MMSRKTLIVNGDSWTFGSEILNPELERFSNIVTEQDFEQNNDSYRIPRIYPTHLSKLMDVDLINLSWPADDNKSILNRTISYISQHYIEPNKSTKDLFVIVGWTSPERNSFWWEDSSQSDTFRLWPHHKHFDRPLQEDFWKIYVDSMWNEQEYIPRYILNILQFQSFCNQYDIKWMCFNAFAADSKPKVGFHEWEDLDIRKCLDSHTKNVGATPITTHEVGSRIAYSCTYLPIWKMIDSVRFYKKDQKNNTFKSFVEQNVDVNSRWYGIHPSPHSHEMWANEIFNYMKENKLL